MGFCSKACKLEFPLLLLTYEFWGVSVGSIGIFEAFKACTGGRVSGILGCSRGNLVKSQAKT